MSTWTPEQLATLSARYANEPTARIAADIGRSATATYQRARSMGLRKSAAYLAGAESGRINVERGAECRFRKGHATWNKGMKGLDIGGHETRFKPGSKPQTWLPIGSERVTKDGILQRKVADTGVKAVDWKGVHTLIWEGLHGPVPSGRIIIFADRNKRNFDPLNLECVDRAGLMRRNTVHRLPKELAELVQLRGALNRQINQRESK